MGWQEASTAKQMANSLNFGTNTFNQSDHDSAPQFISYMLMLGGQWSWVWDMLRQAIQSELVRNRYCFGPCILFAGLLSIVVSVHDSV